MQSYTDASLIDIAEDQVKIFERPSAPISIKLIARVKELEKAIVAYQDNPITKNMFELFEKVEK